MDKIITVDINEFTTDEIVAELISRKSSLVEKHRTAIQILLGYSSNDLYENNCIILNNKIVYRIENLSDVIAVEGFVKKRKQL